MRFVGAVISTAKTISQEDIARNTFWAGAKLVKTNSLSLKNKKSQMNFSLA